MNPAISQCFMPLHQVTEMRENFTFDALTNQWMTRQKITAKESTLATYQTIIKKQLQPTLGEVSLTQFDVEFINQFVVDKLESGLSPKYVRDILTILRSILNFAGQVYGYYIPYRSSSLPKANISDAKALDEKERKRLEYLTFQSCDHRDQGIFLCLYSGLRIGELCALRWSDFSPERDVISVRRTLQRITDFSESLTKTKIIITHPKTHRSARNIPLPEFLSVHLKEHSSHIASDAYFLTGKSDVFMEPRAYQDYFARYLRRHDFEPTNFHTLRHTFATRCVNEGFDAKTLSEILGHANVEITLNKYVHIGMETKKKNMNLLTM